MRGLYSLEPSCANRLERIDFYRKMLGIEPSKVRTGYAKFDIQNPPLNLALNEVPDLAARSALSHLGLHVASTDDVLAIRTRWAEAGLVTRDEMQTDCCYATQDKTWVHERGSPSPPGVDFRPTLTAGRRI